MIDPTEHTVPLSLSCLKEARKYMDDMIKLSTIPEYDIEWARNRQRVSDKAFVSGFATERTCPQDFLTLVRTIGFTRACKRYRCSHRTGNRWLKFAAEQEAILLTHTTVRE